MMTRHCSGKHLSRTPHSNRTERPPIRNNSIYRIRSLFLLWVLLSLLSLKPCPYSWTRRMLTAYGYSPPQPPRSSPPQHVSPTSFRSIYHLSPPQPDRRKSQPHTPSSIYHYLPRSLLYPTTSLRILRNFFHNRRRSIWLNILHGHRIPWPTCYYWLNFPYRMLPTPIEIPLHI